MNLCPESHYVSVFSQLSRQTLWRREKTIYVGQLLTEGEAPMRPLPIAALAAILLVASGAAFPTSPAEAQGLRRGEQPTREITITPSGRKVVRIIRPRTRLTVRPRSYLDAGTEVLPGERKFTDYVYGPTYSVTGVIDPTSGYGCCWPLPMPFERAYSGF
jgi:hypothetical protein